MAEKKLDVQKGIVAAKDSEIERLNLIVTGNAERKDDYTLMQNEEQGGRGGLREEAPWYALGANSESSHSLFILVTSITQPRTTTKNREGPETMHKGIYHLANPHLQILLRILKSSSCLPNSFQIIASFLECRLLPKCICRLLVAELDPPCARWTLVIDKPRQLGCLTH